MKRKRGAKKENEAPAENKQAAFTATCSMAPGDTALPVPSHKATRRRHRQGPIMNLIQMPGGLLGPCAASVAPGLCVWNATSPVLFVQLCSVSISNVTPFPLYSACQECCGHFYVQEWLGRRWRLWQMGWNHWIWDPISWDGGMKLWETHSNHSLQLRRAALGCFQCWLSNCHFKF